MRTQAMMRTGEDRGEAELVRRLQARDAEAMEELYDRLGPQVYRLALCKVRDRAVAEDLTQDTFLAVWTRIGSFDGERGSLAGWIGAMARNRAIDYLRSMESRRAHHSVGLEWGVGSTAGEAAQVERVRLLAGPWARLKRQQQEVLWMAHWSGLSQPEIAERLQKPLGTVKTWMRGAHQVLRAALEGADAH